MENNIQIIVNGTTHHLATGTGLYQLLESLDLGGKRVAVELNGEIVPRSRHAQTVLHDGDELLIVQAIGGG